MLEKFMSFAKALPSDRMESVEEALAALMESLSEKYDFSEPELTELNRRISAVNPSFSDKGDITEIFGKSFSA